MNKCHTYTTSPFPMRTALLVCVACLSVAPRAEAASGTFRPEAASFTVRVQDVETSLRTLGVYTLPRETLEIEAFGDELDTAYLIEIESGSVFEEAPNRWSWRAPAAPGLYPLRIERISGAQDRRDDYIALNVFVMVPSAEMNGESLCGYRIGCYPESPPEKLPACTKPKGFVEVTEENMEALVSPHFTLSQFLCKQQGRFPKYVVLNEHLLMKLECALESVNERGIRCDTFHIMSGYRTPDYNRALGNARFSQHLWGSAADIFVDESPRDGEMDDLNGDGVIDINDTTVLYQAIDELCADRSNEVLVGGLARYKRTSRHGPFVHLDVRGYRARWGS